MRRIITSLYKISNFIKLHFIFIFFVSRTVKNELWKNKVLKNKEKGKRCFILGNGPSMKEEDLSSLKNDVVFAVNQIARNKQFGSFPIKYYFCVDDNFFDTDQSQEYNTELLQRMQQVVKSNQEISCFYPYRYKGYVEENKLAGKNTYYMLPRLTLYPHYNQNFDCSRYVPGFGTVVQYAIMYAIYMGFKEIYLLGCDSTGIMSTLNAALGVENKTYSYEVTANETKRMEEMVKNSKVVDYAYSYYLNLNGFEILGEYCSRRKIKLINLSSTTVLDMLPRNRLKNIIKGENNL